VGQLSSHTETSHTLVHQAIQHFRVLLWKPGMDGKEIGQNWKPRGKKADLCVQAGYQSRMKSNLPKRLSHCKVQAGGGSGGPSSQIRKRCVSGLCAGTRLLSKRLSTQKKGPKK